MNDSPTQPASATARLSGMAPAALRLAQAGAEALRQQRPDVAEHDLRTALMQAPAHPEVERLLALALRAQGKNAEALELLRLAAQRWPADVLVQNGLGTALDACGEREAAIAAFRRACELAPQAAPVWANLGKTLCDYGLFEEAVPVLERVAAMTDHAASKIRLAHALRALGRIDDADRLLRAMLERDPADSEVWLALAGLKTRP
ncbi:MAG: tetratricopeptide repeat protein, partial [Rudaea sp.]